MTANAHRAADRLQQARRRRGSASWMSPQRIADVAAIFLAVLGEVETQVYEKYVSAEASANSLHGKIVAMMEAFRRLIEQGIDRGEMLSSTEGQTA